MEFLIKHNYGHRFLPVAFLFLYTKHIKKRQKRKLQGQPHIMMTPFGSVPFRGKLTQKYLRHVSCIFQPQKRIKGFLQNGLFLILALIKAKPYILTQNTCFLNFDRSNPLFITKSQNPSVKQQKRYAGGFYRLYFSSHAHSPCRFGGVMRARGESGLAL